MKRNGKNRHPRRRGELLLTIQVQPLEEGGYLATSDDLQGLLAEGKTVAQTVEIAKDVARKLIESYLEHGDPLPPKIRRALKQAALPSIRLTIPVEVETEAVAL